MTNKDFDWGYAPLTEFLVGTKEIFFSNEYLKEPSTIEHPVSACCSAHIDMDTLFCQECHDHSDWVEVEYEPEWTEAELSNMWGE